MANEETIYMGMGNTQSENTNESVLKNVVAKAWKPVTIGGLTGIVLGAGALMAQKAYAASQEADEAPVDEAKQNTAKVTPAVENEVVDAPVETPVLNEAAISDEMSFEEAFAEARAQVGPGGIFQWHGVIFSTYTADEWEAMTEEEHENYAMLVRPEVEAHEVNTEEIAAQEDVEAVEEPQEPFVDEEAVAQEVDHPKVSEVAGMMEEEVVDIPVREMNEDFILADMHAAEEGFALADQAVAEAQADDDVVVDGDVVLAETAEADNEDIALADIAVADEDVAMADVAVADEDIAIAEDVAQVEDIAVLEDNEDIAIADIAESEDAFSVEEMYKLSPDEDMAMADVATKGVAPQNSDHGKFEDFLDDSQVRIVGYGEFDGHAVRGLDLDGDGHVDIAVIDVDDSGDLSREDIVVEDGNGNMSTYGELQDFAMNHQDATHEDSTNPDVAEDMPDYMDDALAQL